MSPSSTSQHLREAGIVADLVAVSSAMRHEAVARRDPALDGESGFPVLERYLVEQVVGQADLLARRSIVHDVMMVTEQIGESLRAEEASHRDPAAAERIIEELKRAQERAAALRERSARWQLTLSDGIADLNADVDHDLRDRMREIVRGAEEAIDDNGDPTKAWQRHADHLRQQCASAVAANYLWATERSRELARKTAWHFAEEHEAVLPALRIDEPSAQIGAGGDLAVRDHERWNLGNKALTALRGGYIGVLMFGMLGSVVGMSLINPFSVGAGVLLGGKAIVDERRRIIARRQSEAKAAVRRHVDEVVFQVGKDSREMLRVVQRDLRDHYSELADQLNRSIRESVASAERSVQATQAERERRLTEISNELPALGALRARVGTSAGSGGFRRGTTRSGRPARAGAAAYGGHPGGSGGQPRPPRGNARPADGPDGARNAPRGAVAPHSRPRPARPGPGRPADGSPPSRGAAAAAAPRRPPAGSRPRRGGVRRNGRCRTAAARPRATHVARALVRGRRRSRWRASAGPAPEPVGGAVIGQRAPRRPSRAAPARLRRMSLLLLPGTRQALSAAAHAYRSHPTAAHRCAVLARRLDGPLRVALAGRVKAGKSTLLNALTGDRLAPADVGECTRVVTWYRSAPEPRITLEPRTGSPRPLPVHRREGALEIDLGDSAGDVERLVVDWPAPGLRDWTVIDTPGVASLSADVSARATQLLDPAGGSDHGPDAVIYLMRHVHAADVDLLQTLRGARSSRFVNTIAVLSRADEIGSGVRTMCQSAWLTLLRWRGLRCRRGLRGSPRRRCRRRRLAIRRRWCRRGR